MDNDVVRWAASQSTNPALQALMREAERDNTSRPSTPVHEPASWTRPLTLPLSSASLPPRASAPAVSRRANPLASSANQPPRHSARPRSSSHSTALHAPQDEEPEAVAFIELLKHVSRQVDANAQKKQRVATPLGRTHNPSARPLAKTSSASVISTRAPEQTSSSSMSAHRPEPRGHALAKTESWSAPDVVLVSGKSTPTSLPSPNLNCDLKLAPAHRPPAILHPNHATARMATFPATSNDGDSAMQDVIDLTDTDQECERPISVPISRADTTMCMELDDEDSDAGMDVSFFTPDPPPQSRVPAPKSKPQPTTASRFPAPTQRTRTGPPPLGMRRVPQLQPSQYSSSQGLKGVTAPRFKPPLLANAGGVKNGSGTRPTTTTTSRPAPRGSATKVAAAEIPAQDADSSFDVSFDMDADALEEAMKAYD